MKLVYPPYDISVELVENRINVLSIENPKAYTEVLRDFWLQTQGEMGNFIMSEGEKNYELSKMVICIFNPFDINCNDKKILSKLYQEVKVFALENHIEDNAKVNSILLNYLELILQGVPYGVEYSFDFDIVGLMKLYNVAIQTIGGTLLENLVEYLRVAKQVCNISYFAIVGLKYYLNEDELKQLYEFVFYEKTSIIIVEATHSYSLECERCWILDKDLCLISPF